MIPLGVREGMFEQAQRAVVCDMPALVYWDTIAFIAVCIRYDILTQGGTRSEALVRLEKTILAEKAIRDNDPTEKRFEDLDPPPAKFIAAWEALA